MRVLLVYKDYYPVVGGIENHIQLLAEGLRERGVDARVLVTNTGRHTRRESINGVPVLKTGRIASISSAPISPSFYYHFSRETRGVDITHLHFPYPPAEIGQLFLDRSKHFVLTYHSDIVRQKYLGALYRPLLWRALRAAQAITVSNPQYISSSPFLRTVAHKTRVIPFGIDLARFARTPTVDARAAEIRKQHRLPLILAVGKLRHYKGFDILIRALQEIPDARALIVGSGPMLPAWQALAARLGLDSRVSFLGELPEDELIAHYYAADVLAFPSTNRAETWGIVQIEAMTCGLPIIGTELGTGTSFVNENGVTGIIVPPGDPSAFAVALARLLADPALRRQMGAAGQERARRLFSRDIMIDRTLDFYSDVVQGKFEPC